MVVRRIGGADDDEALDSRAVASFAQLGECRDRWNQPVPRELLNSCISCIGGKPVPTAIQSECWGWLLSPCAPDMVATSPTGSGKTLAFLLPAIAELLGQLKAAQETASVAVDISECDDSQPAEAPPDAPNPTAVQGDVDAAANAAGSAAMRAAATAAFAREISRGTPQVEARAIARAEAKAAWREAVRAEKKKACQHERLSALRTTSDVDSNLEQAAIAPYVLVLAPTRELCQQTTQTCEAIIGRMGAQAGMALPAGASVGCVVGGVDFHRQRDALLAQRPRLLVATPGRLLSLCGGTPASTIARQQANQQPSAQPTAERTPQPPAERAPPVACALSSVRMLVLDEADRLLELGFEADLLALRALMVGRCGDRAAAHEGVDGKTAGAPSAGSALWTLMFSATWGRSTQALASTMLSTGALRIAVGAAELAASTSVSQRFEIMRGKGAPRMRRLCALLCEYLRLDLDEDASIGGLDAKDGPRQEGNERGHPYQRGHQQGQQQQQQQQQQEEEEHHEEDELAAALAAEEDERSAEEPSRELDHAQGRERQRTWGADTSDTSDGVLPVASAAEALTLTLPPLPGGRASRVVVFVLYKQEARAVAKLLVAKGFPAAAIHGDLSQTARTTTLQRFRQGDVRVLVATDVAARGLDVAGVTHVINFSLGLSLDMYVHRCGRCGRAGATGVAHSFVIDGDEALVPPLVELLERSRQAVPKDLKDLSVNIIKRGARSESRRHCDGNGGRAKHDSNSDEGSDSDEDAQRQRQRAANRQKQKEAQQRRVQKERAQQNQKKRGPIKLT